MTNDTLAKLAAELAQLASEGPALIHLQSGAYICRKLGEAASALTAQALPAAPEPVSFTFSPMWLAPIDGTPVMLYMPTTTDKFAVGHWHGNCWGDDEGRYFTHEPTAFCSLKNLERFTVRPAPQAAQQAAQAPAGWASAASKAIEVLTTTAGNIRSLGPAGALEPWANYLVWLDVVEKAAADLANALPQPQEDAA